MESVLIMKGDFNDNYGLNPSSNGYVLGEITDLTSDFIYETHDSRFDLIGNIVARGYAGPGQADAPDVVLPRIQTKYHKGGKRTAIDIGASYALQRLNANDALDVTGNGGTSNQHLFNANMSVAQKLGPRDTLTWANTAARSIFDGAGTDNFSVDSALSWNRRLTKRTDGTLLVGVNWLTLEDDSNTEKIVYRTKASLSSQLSKRLMFRAGAGVNLTDSRQTVSGSRMSDLKTGLLADLGLDYQLKTTKISLAADYGLQQGTFGDLQTRANASLNIAQEINERSSAALSITGQMVQSAGSSSTSDAIFGLYISPTYTVSLTDEWDMTAGYKFSLKDNVGGTAVSNDVFVSLTRDFVVMP